MTCVLLGTFIFPDGSRYEGSWVEDQRNGHGVYRFANGDTYEGDWYEHKKHGYGIYTYAATGTSYRGMWEAGKKKGPGDIVHANHKFSGEFLLRMFVRSGGATVEIGWFPLVFTPMFHFQRLNISKSLDYKHQCNFINTKLNGLFNKLLQLAKRMALRHTR